jgi:Zn-dependent M28 family amino/carboxypeptidase
MNKISLLALIITVFLVGCQTNPAVEFDGENAYLYAQSQMDFGPRTPGSAAHQKTIDLITDELSSNGWEVEIQSEERNGYLMKNVIGKNSGAMDQPWIILGAHYDTRFYANMDSDIEKQLQPVPGANDGASGVAVLLELARVLPDDLNKNIWLVFFDAEDQGSIEGWDWILGSRSFVKTLQSKPDAVVIVDMIGDKNLNVYYERNSDVGVQEEIWEIAAGLGYEKHFIPEYKYSMLDDHTPFLEKGMVAIDIIDFDYPYWHTSQDTIDKISPESLEMIGTTIYHWLLVP